MIISDHVRDDRGDQDDAAQPIFTARGEPMATVTVPAPACLELIVIPEALADTACS